MLMSNQVAYDEWEREGNAAWNWRIWLSLSHDCHCRKRGLSRALNATRKKRSIRMFVLTSDKEL